MSPRKLALGFALLLLAAAVPAVSNASVARPAVASTWLVAGAVEDARVLDDYGAFVTMRLTEAEAGALRAEGRAVEPLDTTFLRGAWTIAGDDRMVPPAMRAAETDPFFVVQFRGPVKAAWREALAAQSVRVYDALPNFAFAAKLAPGQAEALRAMPEVAFVGAHHPAYKLAPELPASGEARVTILAFPGEPLARVVAQVAAGGGEVRAATTGFALDGIVKATMRAEALPAMARLAEVSWIEPSYDEASLDNAQSSAITQGGGLATYNVHAKGVDGRTQVLSVCDTGVKTDSIAPHGVRRMRHEMFNHPTGMTAAPLRDTPVVWMLPNGGALFNHRKMQGYYAPMDPLALEPGGDFDDANGHGTHTAGTIAGDAPPYGARNGNDGVAFAAKLLVCDITNGGSFVVPTEYSVMWDPALVAGARVNSNSWGSSHTRAYTEVARQHDAYVDLHRDFLILRSMGNIPNTIRPEAVAKSAMAIGATLNGAGMESLASFSGTGGTEDGRIKPDVIAPGACLVSSGTGTNNYVCLSGTSMSTPTVAGAAGLVRDYFAQGFYPSGTAKVEDSKNPSAALVRGILTAGGKRITGSLSGAGFPNTNQGWGRVLLDDALFFAGDARKLFVQDEAAGLNTGDTKSFDIVVAAGQPLRVVLTWSDDPAAAGANPTIVNDLDLTVTGPGGSYVGNAFVNGETPPNQGARDARNVAEGVYLNAPAAGTYTVTVRGTNVPSGPQSFALVATHG